MGILLNAKHELFCLAYIRWNSKTRAAAEAGYSPKTAKQQGHRLSFEPSVAARIAELRAAQYQALQMENDEILARLAAVARGDPRRLYRADGTLKGMHELTADDAAMIGGIEHDEVRGPSGDHKPGPKRKGAKVDTDLLRVVTRKVRLRDPVPALRILAQHRKLIGTEADEALSNIAAAFADRMAAARQRRREQQSK